MQEKTETAGSLEPKGSGWPPLKDGHPVLDLIAARLESGSKPHHRSDDEKLVLVIEGGGMRGVVSGGMVTALDELGLHDTFDMVVGTSAGALAGAFFLARQPRMGTSIYYEDLTGREWLDYRRGIKGTPILALDYLFDELMATHKPLDWAAVIESSAPLYAIATEWPSYEKAVFGSFRTPDELRSALRASARIPVITGEPVELNDSLYIDGSLSESIPMQTALDFGATHLLVLLTRPPGKVRRDPGWAQRNIAFPVMNWKLTGLGKAYSQRAPRYRRELALLEQLEAGGQALGIKVADDAGLVGQLEQNPRALFSGAAKGAEAVHLALTGSTSYSFGELEAAS
jgi:predicted patatin/cPLA2 family phospholipase